MMKMLYRGYQELLDHTRQLQEPFVIGFFGDFSKRSEEAKPVFKSFCQRHPELLTFLVEVTQIKDIHGQFGVVEVPAVLVVRGGQVANQVLGPQSLQSYEAALLGQPNQGGKAPGATKAAPKVLVYTGQNCVWCTKVKSYLKQLGVSFTEIDVSRDRAAGEALVRKTGQMGVPQLDIGGQFVVGFDQRRIDALLGLSSTASHS
jgi:glutaredoxin-like YruB-family protein